jgi:UPF0716 protein FxsA
MVRPVTTTIFAWLFSEIIVFVLVVRAIGLIGAIVVGVLTSLLGAAMIRRVGAEALSALRQALDGGEPREGALLDGALSALGGVLLVLPGFVSDAVGIALAAPSFRQWLTHRFGGKRPVRAQVIDLSPQEWKSVEDRGLSSR